jgi:hypothetical protein
VTAFGGAGVTSGTSASTNAGAYGQALGALTFGWDGAATPTLTSPTGATGVTQSGQAMAGFAGIPASLLAAASTGGAGAGKNSYAITPC